MTKVFVYLLSLAILLACITSVTSCGPANDRDGLTCNHVEVTDSAVAPTCYSTGLTQGSHCSLCGEVIVAQQTLQRVEHNMVTVAGIEPTCTEDGYTEYLKCTECEHVENFESLPATHSLELVLKKEATCTEDGYDEYYACTRCTYHTEITVLPMGHDIVYVVGAPSVCHDGGYVDYEYCTGCSYSTYNSIPASHTIVTVDYQAPTCVSAGHDAYEYCSACQYTTYSPIPAIAHEYADVWTVDILATESANGERSRHCIYDEATNCGMRTDVTEYAYEHYTEGLKFTLMSDGTWEVSIGEAEGKDIIVPATYLGIPVTKVGKFDKSIKSISLPEGIVEIGYGAFYNIVIECGKITLPSTVKKINSAAFETNGLYSIDFGGSMPYVPYDAIGTRLHEVYVSSLDAWFNIVKEYAILQHLGHLYIDGELVEGNVIIPDGTGSVVSYAFANQMHVTSVTIPASVKLIGSHAFDNSGVTKIYYDGTLEEWNKIVVYGNSISGINVYIDGALVLGSENTDENDDSGSYIIDRVLGAYTYDGVHSYDIVDGVYVYRAYLGDTSSGVLVLPESIDGHRYRLGENSFACSDWLVSITIQGVDNIENSAFYNCKNLREVILTEGLRCIDAAFTLCTSLEAITIPESVYFINTMAFYGCKKLESVVFLHLDDWRAGESSLYRCHWQRCPECIAKAFREYIIDKGAMSIWRPGYVEYI